MWRAGLDKANLPPFAVLRNLPETNRENEALLLAIHAMSHWLWMRRVPLLPRLLSLFNRIVFSTQIPAGTRIGKDVRLNYSGLGTVLHARAVIGDRVEIGPGVVIGGRSEIFEVPVIEDDVVIGVGAKVLGPVRIGRGAVIGANAVVVHDVPPGAVVAGIPARVLRIGPKTQVVKTQAG
jgi:serine O-acetyltransferase